VLAAWIALPGLASAEGLSAQCRAACEARDITTSCQWIAARPKRCVRHAVRACKRLVRDGFPLACTPPQDLPACLTNHSCPFGALCVNATCQVLSCGAEGQPPCGGLTICDGDKCVVGSCSGSTENCPAGFHCDGLCLADDPNVDYCTNDVACILAGEFDRVCRGGVCERRGRRGRRRRRTTITTTSTTTPVTGASTSTTLPGGGNACFAFFDCGGTHVCCNGQCAPDPFAGLGSCSEIYTPACTLCATDDDCACNGIFCDSCGGTASLSGCVDPCASGLQAE
jgi:hypothetical protein